jgi:dTDP-4-dehydrorhamnose reductase
VACTRAELDLSEVATKPHLISDLVQAIRPSVIVNASAYTAVDKAESETEQSRTLNAVVPGLLAQAANDVGACMVHYSTDYVFDGTKKGSYQEQDQTNPLSVYGQTKLQGEQAVTKACARHLIMRTCWVVSAHGGNFLKTMLKLGLERDHLRVVADQIGAPTSAKLIAQTTTQLLETMLLAPGTDPRWGLYHLAASGQTSWFYYAQYVLSQARARGWPIKVADENIEAIATADYPVAAPRPHNSKLNTSKIRQTFNVVLPDWTEGVDDVLAELFTQYSASSQESPQGRSR